VACSPHRPRSSRRGAQETIYGWLDSQYRNRWMIGLETILGVPVGLAVGWAVAAVPCGIRLRRMLGMGAVPAERQYIPDQLK
jgi:hypothetical protein